MIYTVLIVLIVLSVTITAVSKKIEQRVDTPDTFRGKQTLRRVYNANQYVIWAVRWAVNTLFGRELRGEYGGIVDYMLIYPIKSVSAGLKVLEWEVMHYGLKGDRQYMLAVFDKEEGHYTKISLWQNQKLATVGISFDPKSQMFTFSYQYQDVDYSFQLPVEATEDFVAAHSSEPFNLHRIKLNTQFMNGCVLDQVLPKTFALAMGIPEETILVCSSDGKPCTVCVPKKERTSTVFQDYFPLLVCSQASLEDLRQHGKERTEHVTMSSFRPNVVITDTPSPFYEDSYAYWDLITKDSSRHHFHSPIKCIRCILPNIDYSKGSYDPKYGVTKIMSQYRRVDEHYSYSSCFGIYALPLDQGFIVKSGDKVDVVLRQVNCWLDNPFREKKSE